MAKIKLTLKQTQTIDILEDHENGVTELIYGGSAGSAKTFIGCYWILWSVLKYKGTRGALCRAELKALKKTTLLTFFEICKIFGLKEGRHYTYKEQAGEIHFFNGSVVYLIQTPFLPSDPDFDYLGSVELTFVFMDEIAQMYKKAWDVMRTRIRYRHDDFTPNGEETKDLVAVEWNEYGKAVKWRQTDGKVSRGLSPKLFGSLNPSKNWVYTYFYKPFKSGTMGGSKMFIQALPTDNPYLDDDYRNVLNTLPKAERDRLWLGLWESDEDTQLVTREKAEELFNNDFILPDSKKYIIGDVARLGSDLAVIGYWEGLVLSELYTYQKSRMTELKTVLDTLRKKHRVQKSNILLDEDGVGGGLVDFMGCKGFVNNSTPLEGENYQNLKTQCYYYLADHINDLKMYLKESCFSDELKQRLFEEIEQIRVAPTDDAKLRIINKEQIKSNIGRSPDITDMLAMRMYFEIKNKNKGDYAWS